MAGGGGMTAVLDLIARVMSRLAWVPSILTILLPVVAATLFVFKGDSTSGINWWIVGTGAFLLLLNAGAQAVVAWWNRRDEEAEISAANSLRVAIKDALQPLAGLLASMPYENKSGRLALLKPSATQAVGALTLLKKDVDRARAVVYALDPSRTSMSPLAHAGRGTTPSGFTLGNVRGDRAIALVTSGGHLFVPDLDAVNNEEWAGSGNDYRTFISAAITNGEYSYGMLTLDAPKAGDLSENDEHTVLLMADLLSIAFAEADR